MLLKNIYRNKYGYRIEEEKNNIEKNMMIMMGGQKRSPNLIVIKEERSLCSNHRKQLMVTCFSLSFSLFLLCIDNRYEVTGRVVSYNKKHQKREWNERLQCFIVS